MAFDDNLARRVRDMRRHCPFDVDKWAKEFVENKARRVRDMQRHCRREAKGGWPSHLNLSDARLLAYSVLSRRAQ